mgnify:CR=1 FL=1
MKEMIRKYRGTLISSALVILAGVLVGFTSIQGKWINLFFVVMQCVFVAIIFYDNRNRQQNRKVIGMTIWIIPVITLLYNGIVRLVDMGADIENLFMAFIYYGTGLMFMVIGNYLPKVKQNNTIESGLYGHCRMRKTGMQLIDSVGNYGWHQVFCVCSVVF